MKFFVKDKDVRTYPEAMLKTAKGKKLENILLGKGYKKCNGTTEVLKLQGIEYVKPKITKK